MNPQPRDARGTKMALYSKGYAAALVLLSAPAVFAQQLIPPAKAVAQTATAVCLDLSPNSTRTLEPAALVNDEAAKRLPGFTGSQSLFMARVGSGAAQLCAGPFASAE